jgi:hypothetical protein
MRQWADDLSSNTSFDSLLYEIGQRLLVEYGHLHRSGYEAANVSDNPVVNHFFLCPDNLVLDFIEVAFTTPGWCGRQQTVDKINDIFRDSAIGYELTPFVMTINEPAVSASGTTLPRTVDIQYPKIIARQSQYLHSEATQPALSLLTDQRYKGANDEFLKAQEYFRKGDFPACLNECLKAFESTMKIICHHKSWAYNQSDTASQLVSKCLANGLLPSYSQEQLNSLSKLLTTTIPTPRNKQSGHGQGVQTNSVTPDLAKFALNSTASTIVLLIEAANI